MSQIVAFSGGKDSTALVLRLAELGEQFECLFTPTGDELPELRAHIERVMSRVGKSLILPANKTLAFWMNFHSALPNFRMRWCTRQIKIEPCIAWLVAHPGSILLVGLRADEESRVGLYGDYAKYRYPLREWNWSLTDVRSYLRDQSIIVPSRTDCALCYGQRLIEWHELWLQHPSRFAEGEALEQRYGHTFRSAQRDSWPASLSGLRARFESGDVPRDTRSDAAACRVCSL